MFKSCKYCGGIHESNYVCDLKPKRKDYTERSEIDKFRSTRKWTNKSLSIKKRDMNLCQVCIRKIYNTISTYNYINLQVHHIIPIHEDWEKRLEDDNLITLCSYHHKLAENGKINRAELLNIVREQENNIPPVLIS